ncbi:DNA-binding LacI/PurR family transcriptional regulator [Paenibacillus sp. BK033]|uniref:GntR family transcriptional regulator n=1 Tax=Paenibacillus sp. BK033 TaxID=2512133 RepID=UPI00104DB3D2|nr:GntR family transcriptional regulator [Paenibacillus sp. BK033]TCM99531.1 DNA-binding LacI/PurR family transcriptional regulator [Paenibacillus sp. BK033]
MKDIPLYKQIQEAIKSQISLGNLRPGDRIPSEKDLAAQFHVSLMTTKNALAGLAEEGIVIRSKGKGTFVAGQAPYNLFFPADEGSRGERELPAYRHSYGKLIGMIIPSMRTQVEQRLLDAIENAVNGYGYTLVIRVSRGSAAKELQSLEDLGAIGISGLILFSIGALHERRTVVRAEELECPVVLIDRYYNDRPVVSVCSDNKAGSRKAVSYLVGKGHHRLALLTPPVEHSVMADRLAGFESAVAEFGLKPSSVLRYTVPYQRFNVSRKDGAELIHQWMLIHHDSFTGLVATDVELARLAYHALKRINRTAGKQLVAFDDTEIPEVAYIRQNEAAIGAKAVSLLMGHIARGEQLQGRFVVPTQLILPS